MSVSLSRRRALALAAAVPLVLAGCSRAEDPLAGMTGINLTDARMGGDFTLDGPGGKPVSLSDYKGKVVLMFFGFTQCPDVCPTALSTALMAREMLGEDAKHLQVLFVSVDPERDTAEVLEAYTQAFDPSFVGLRGTPEQTAEVARLYKVYYEKIPTESSYTIDHTALSYVHDTEGKLRLALRYNDNAEAFASDIRRLLPSA